MLVKITVDFWLPRDENLKKIWVRFVNRKDWSPSNSTHAPLSTSALKVPIRILRTSPKKRNMFADEYVEFVNEDKIMKFEIIDETLALPGYIIAK